MKVYIGRLLCTLTMWHVQVITLISCAKLNKQHRHGQLIIFVFYWWCINNQMWQLLVLEKSCFVNFCSRRWGSSLRSLRMLDPPLGPPSTLAEIFRRTCLQSHLQTSPPTPQKCYPKFRNPRTTFGNTPLCPPIYSVVRGVGGSPIF